MTDPCENVKATGPPRLVAWIDCHPRTGWYLACIGTLNVFLTFLTLVLP
jgi:hypothetical protein